MSISHDTYDEADIAFLPQNLFKNPISGLTSCTKETVDVTIENWTLDGSTNGWLNKRTSKFEDTDGKERLFGTTKMYGKSLSVCPMITHESYDMENPKRGYAVIIDNSGAGHGGKENIQQMLEWLGFDVHVWKNCSASSIKDIMYRVSSWNHADNDALVCVISTTAASSGGDEEAIQAADGSVSMHTLTSMFSDKCCPSLAGKPKIFFLLQTIITEGDETQTIPDNLSFHEHDEENQDLTLLPQDSLVIMSQQVTHTSLQDDKDDHNKEYKVAEFTSALYKILQSARRFENVDILTQLGVVNRQIITCVHTPAKVPRPQTLHIKPVLCYFSTLTKRLCLKPKT